MLRDALFTEETTAEDLVLARAMLAERSPEDIAAALARLYRARLPSPEDILDPGQGSGRSRDDRGRRKDAQRPSRDDDRGDATAIEAGKIIARHGMAEGSVWFRAAIGRRKNAEARWLLPMICRRGGIDKHDIGAIRIMDTTTEFEISKAVAESFAAKIRRPDKEDNIRIELLADASQTPSEERSHPPRHEGGNPDRSARRNGPSRGEERPKQHGKPHGAGEPKFNREPGFEKKKRYGDRPAHTEQMQPAGASLAKPPFGKKKKKNRPG